MTEIEQHTALLQKRLQALKERWIPGYADFWNFIGVNAGITARSAYNFGTGRPNAQNSRRSTITGIEIAIAAAESALFAMTER